MPPKAEILSKATELKEHLYGMKNHQPETVEEWSGKENGATFHLTKPEGVYAVAEGTPSSLMLGIRGKKEGREQIEKDFIEAFGIPKTIFPARKPAEAKVLFWDTSKALDPERMDGSKAYRVAMKNLESTWSYPGVLKELYPNRYFDYETGWGLVLPHGLVHISTETAEGIELANGAIETIKDKPSFIAGKEFRYIDGKIPEEAIRSVIFFTETVKKNIYDSVHKKGVSVGK
jgi:hypothetical protein